MKKILGLIFLSSAVSLLFTSCLKERVGNIDTGNGNTTNVVEFRNTGDNVATQTSKYPRFNTDMGNTNKLGQTATINLNFGYSGVDAAPTDITVNIALDADALALFNTQNGTDFEVPANDIYTFPSSVVIKKGERVATTQFTIKITSSYNFLSSYALPLKIASTSPAATISGNFGSAIYSFGGRNSLDGIYTITALAPMVDATNPAFTGKYPLVDVQLRTTPKQSAALYDGQYVINGYAHPFLNNGSLSYYGSFSPQFYYVGTGLTKVVNYYGQPSSNNRSAQIEPSYANTITFNADGSVNHFDVKYYMYQAGNKRTTFTERYTRTADRPL